MSLSSKYIKIFYPLLLAFLPFLLACTEEGEEASKEEMKDSTLTISKKADKRGFTRVKIGAEILFDRELDRLEGKMIGVVSNQTSRFWNGTHLVDSLLSRGIEVKKVFAPEHGFRGTADAGEHVKDGVDTKTGLPMISLYGKNRKPEAQQLADLDMVIFDIQDVGVRLYTYISTMTYVMEACSENGLAFMVLDRPNPNGDYVDGPVLEQKFSSFIGLHEIPVVHGMTLVEYATMIKEEKGFSELSQLDFHAITCEGYRHDMKWEATGWPWRPPSPNLASVEATSLYPGLVFFEPTPVSIGRGTDSAFTLVGAPWFKPESDFRSPNARGAGGMDLSSKATSITFTPRSLPGKSKYPKFQDQLCAGMRFEEIPRGKELFMTSIELFQRAYTNYRMMHAAQPFFQKNFNRWPGNTNFQQQIKSGLPVDQIYESWQPRVEAFKKIRAKYLLYP